MTGSAARLIYVVGPSGAGKDTVLRWLATHQRPEARLHVARRTVTRPAGDASELHEPVTPAEFAQLLRAGAFALHWAANGLRYGIRCEELLALDNGSSVIVNGSRAALYETRRRYPEVFVVQITADMGVLRQRLLMRGRERPEVIESRLSRTARLPIVNVDAVIRNEGTPEQAAVQFIALLSP
ncbi:MAG: phosphonate metabolism protein/1,5-bisphosphokinase (PRPP-forming) PhnN [Pseudomonadota bacterium]|nr:phosphonate metabolism protein/1,5-bisphosphokinase (PRPP-forming) PhnN [Pseudomonadota bacterium]